MTEPISQDLPHQCCGKPMHNLPIQDMLGNSQGDTWTCLICGYFELNKTGTLDEEELDDYKDNMEAE